MRAEKGIRQRLHRRTAKRTVHARTEPPIDTKSVKQVVALWQSLQFFTSFKLRYAYRTFRVAAFCFSSLVLEARDEVYLRGWPGPPPRFGAQFYKDEEEPKHDYRRFNHEEEEGQYCHWFSHGHAWYENKYFSWFLLGTNREGCGTKQHAFGN